MSRQPGIVSTVCSFVLLAIFVSCSGETPDPGSWSPGKPVTPPGDVLAGLRNSDRAMLYRVAGESSRDYAEHKTKPKIGAYANLAETPLTDAALAELADILGDGRNYLRENETWTCLPQPSYLIQARRAAETIDVVLHECGDVEIRVVTAGESRQWQHGLRASPAQDRVWSILRSALPAAPNCCAGPKSAT